MDNDTVKTVIVAANSSTCFDRMNKRANVRANQLRRALAQEAARIMSEHGIDNFLLAKRKAAENLNVMDASALPNNKEIEEALAEHHRLFGGTQHDADIEHLRRVALRAMRTLREFQPRLVGPVLTGSASAHSEITLHLFTDRPEDVAIKLLEHGIPNQESERRLRYERERIVTYPAFRFVAGEQPIDAIVFPVDGIRQSPASPVDGRPMRRGDIAELETLVSSTNNEHLRIRESH